jgi:acyl dehydratase
MSAEPPPERRAFASLQELAGFVGQEVVSGWLVVGQERIAQFAEATEDRQWIHLDPERARQESPLGTTIAHGFLTLSLSSHLLQQCVSLDGAVGMALNYGLDRVRFPSPVPAGSRVRGRFRLRSLEPVRGGWHAVWSANVEREGSDKPCLAAEWLVRYYESPASGR